MFLGWNNIKKVIKDLYNTLSAKTSFLSSKRVERFLFTITSILLIDGTFIYLVHKGTLTSTDTIILISPLLVAAGYNLDKTEKAKKKDSDEAVD